MDNKIKLLINNRQIKSTLKNKIKRLNNKKGSAMIEYTIGLLLLVTLVCFLFDVIIIAQKQYIVSQQANLLTRELAVQGGVLTTVPQGFHGNDINYIRSSEMYTAVKNNLEKAGISTTKGEWSVNIITYTKSGAIASNNNLSSSSNIKADYGIPIDVTINFKYNWTLFSQIMPGLSQISANTSRHSVSEFKYNYDSWGGEN